MLGHFTFLSLSLPWVCQNRGGTPKLWWNSTASGHKVMTQNWELIYQVVGCSLANYPLGRGLYPMQWPHLFLSFLLFFFFPVGIRFFELQSAPRELGADGSAAPTFYFCVHFFLPPFSTSRVPLCESNATPRDQLSGPHLLPHNSRKEL